MSDEVALVISKLKQVIRIPGGAQTFTLHVDGELRFRPGSFVGILGQTGCGKTTLLTVLGLLRGASADSTLDRFEVSLADADGPTDLVEVWKRNRSRKADKLRGRHFGFALQNGELLPSLTVAENIAFPLAINGWPRRRKSDRVEQLLDAFRLYRSFDDEGRQEDGAADDGAAENSAKAGTRAAAAKPASKGGVLSLADVRVNYLSGGQYQRVALARAVAHRPQFLFVDEPTASLNRGVARVALGQLRALCSEEGARGAVFMVTHDELFAKEFCDRIVKLRPRSGGGPAGEVIFNERVGNSKREE